MRLYKYKSIDNLWYALDMVVHNRLYCAHWKELNDPLEGRFELYLGSTNPRAEKALLGRIGKAKDKWRIASLSADPTNFLLWSHYANGHKGIAVEVDIPDTDPALFQVTYSPFLPVFTDPLEREDTMHYLFRGKTEEWAYEKEYRVIHEHPFYSLPEPISRILVGPMVDDERFNILRTAIPVSVNLVRTSWDSTTHDPTLVF